MDRKTTIIVIVGLFVSPCFARIITVDDDGPADFSNIQSAINDANDGDTVIVRPGIYSGTGNRDIDFLGKAITVKSIDPNDFYIVETTIIYCQGSDSDPHRGFYFHNSEDCNSILSGVTITNGNVSESGGGIYCSYSSPTITNCRIISNHANWSGGGIFCREGNATIRRCMVTGNTVHEDYNKTGQGAGIMVRECGPLIEHCIITNNSTTGKYGFGGGIGVWYGVNPTIISNCLISGNYAANYGGGIVNGSSDIGCIVKNCTVTSNTACSDDGGISGNNNAIIINSIFWNNSPAEIPPDFLGVSYSNVEGGYPGIGNINADPVFDCNYHLLSGSPCIDTGDPDFIPSFKETDIDAEPRTMGGRVDMGADEFTSTPIPFFQLWPENFDFYAPDVNGLNPVSQVLYICNFMFGTLNWQIGEDCTWLHVDPNYGNSTEETDQVILSADINNLPEGRYSCELTISDPNAGNNPKTISVNLAVGRSTIELEPNEFELWFSLNRPVPEDKILVISNRGGDILNWTAEIDCNWLEVEPNMGTIAPTESNEITLRIINTEILEIGQYTCQIMVSDACSSNNPQRADVTLHVKPEGHLYVPSEHNIIQSAIEAAISGDTVFVADGVYTGPGNSDIDFLGKAITVRSENGPQTCIINCNGSYEEPHRGFIFQNGEERDSVLDGFTIINGYSFSGGGGIRICASPMIPTISRSSPTINNCIITNNYTEPTPGCLCTCSGGGIYISGEVGGSGPLISNCMISNNVVHIGSGGGIKCGSIQTTLYNCIITGNTVDYWGGGIYSYGNLTLSNCTITDNAAPDNGGGIYFSHRENISINNCIIQANSPDQIYPADSNIPITFSNIGGGWPGMGNIDTDPCFADPNNGDYHLKSEGWSWDNDANQWTWDDVTSRCIDAGNPGTLLGDEPVTLDVDPLNRFGENLRINMGAYGGTDEASMPPYDWALLADLSNDGTVDFLDFAGLANDWRSAGQNRYGDLNRDGLVNFEDIVLLVEDWLKVTSWN